MIGSALPLIRLASAVMAVVCFAIVFVTMRANGMLVLGTAAFVVMLWTFGVFTRDFWVSDDPEYGRIDQELEAAERARYAPVPASTVTREHGVMPVSVAMTGVAWVWIIICGFLATVAGLALFVGLGLW